MQMLHSMKGDLVDFDSQNKILEMFSHLGSMRITSHLPTDEGGPEGAGRRDSRNLGRGPPYSPSLYTFHETFLSIYSESDFYGTIQDFIVHSLNCSCYL